MARDCLATSYARQAAIVAQTENLPYPDQTIDLDPNIRDQWGLPAPRLTYDWRRPNELARVEFMMRKLAASNAISFHENGAPVIDTETTGFETTLSHPGRPRPD